MEDKILLKLEDLNFKSDWLFYFKTVISLRINNLENAIDFAYQLFFHLKGNNYLFACCLIETSLRANDEILRDILEISDAIICLTPLAIA